MIARQWHGRVRARDAEAYYDYLLATGLMDYRKSPGNYGVQVLRRREGDEVHYLLTTLWDSWDSIRAFAGDDVERARYYPEDTRYLLELEPTVTHFELLGAAPINRSMPPVDVIPELAYADVGQAARWLVGAFGFRERLRIGDHRAQLAWEDGAVILTELDRPATAADRSHAVMVRVRDLDRHHHRAAEAGARIVRAPETHPYGERQYTAVDPGGHVWTFSETVADVDPRAWGGMPAGTKG